MKKLALSLLACALVVAPMMASAANNVDTTPKDGGRLTPPDGQHLYLGVPVQVTAKITPACTRLAVHDTSFGNVQPSTTHAETPLTVNFECGQGVQPVISFESTTCTMSNGTQAINYEVYPSQPAVAGTGLCNHNGSAPPTLFYQTTVSDSGSESHIFNLQTGDLVNSAGHAIYAVGTYTDTLNVYLEF